MSGATHDPGNDVPKAVRATFRGTVLLGAETVPVKLYPLLRPTETEFRLVDSRDHRPVRQVLLDPETGEAVSRGAALKGYRTDGSLVRLTREELAGIRPESSREITVSALLPPGQPGLRWFNVPYLLGPDEDTEEWSAFSAALAGSRRTGIASWVMRRREYTGALWSHRGFPLLTTLFSEEQMLPPVTGGTSLPEPSAERLELARRLVRLLADEFRPGEIRDTYSDAFRRLLAARDSARAGGDSRLGELLRESVEGDAHA